MLIINMHYNCNHKKLFNTILYWLPFKLRGGYNVQIFTILINTKVGADIMLYASDSRNV